MIPSLGTMSLSAILYDCFRHMIAAKGARVRLARDHRLTRRMSEYGAQMTSSFRQASDLRNRGSGAVSTHDSWRHPAELGLSDRDEGGYL